MNNYQLLRDALYFLLALDTDHATEENGRGYNKIDGPIAREMVEKQEWTPAQAAAVWRMLQKYKGQCPAIGSIPMPTVPPPAPKPAEAGRVIGLDGKKYSVSFTYNPPLVEAVKTINGRKWDGDSKRWLVPQTAILELVSFADRHGFAWTRDAAEARDAATQRAVELEAISDAKTANFDVAGLGGTLLPYQSAGVEYMVKAESCINGDEPGLGKTIQTLAAIHAVSAYPSVIVCPASLKINWQREANKWLPGRTTAILSGAPTTLPTADIYVINYDILARWLPMLKNIKPVAVVLDESHYCKNHKAARTQAAKDLAKGAAYRWLLTGTPIVNRPQELISQLGILSKLESFGGFWGFAKKFCAAYESRFGWVMDGAANLEELNEIMRRTCYVRRRKADVLPELAPIQRNVIYVEAGNRAEYNKAESDLASWVAEREREAAEADEQIKAMTDEDKESAILARSNSAVERTEQAEQLVRIEVLKQLAFDGKLEAAIEWIENFLASEEKLIVFVTHKAAAAAISSHFKAPSITGDASEAARQAAVDAFQDDAETRLIVMNMQAGGVGLTLTAASNVLFLEFGWNPAAHDQAEARAHRIGQKNAVSAWYMLCEETIDEDIWALIESKRAVVDQATDGRVDVDVLKRVAERVAARKKKKVIKK